MKIAIDIRHAKLKTGTGRLVRHLFGELLSVDRKDQFLLIGGNETSLILNHNTSYRINSITMPGNYTPAIRSLWEMFILPYILKVANIDLFISFENFLFPFINLSLPIVSILDLAPLHWPTYYLDRLNRRLRFRIYEKRVRKKKPYIITISMALKNEIASYLNIPLSKIGIVYPGVDKIIGKDSVNPIHPPPNEYIMAMGGIEPRKNMSVFIDACHKFSKKYPEVYFVIIGQNSHEKEILKRWLGDAENRLIFYSGISDSFLSFLLKKARFFVYPSLYEGFGLPPLEAYSHNTPSIVSNIPVMHEILDEAAIYYNHKDSDDLLSKMEILWKDSHLRSQLVENGKKRLSLFTWKRSAKMLMKIIDRLT